VDRPRSVDSARRSSSEFATRRRRLASTSTRDISSAPPVVEAMHEDAKRNAHVIATDATGVLVQANEKCKRGHFWVFVADREHVVFRYTERGVDAILSRAPSPRPGARNS
jgi:hypothetical protein